MTTFDRIDQRMPDLMDELAPARIPDYFDDMLRQSARTRQRPAWSALERWLPMGVIARIEPARQFPWRALALSALLVLAIAAALTLYAGSQQRKAPPPFGPASNGEILISGGGDVLVVDPATGMTRPVVAGNENDEAPMFAPDGRSFAFARTTGPDAGLWTAAADGSDARRLFDWRPYTINWVETGDRLVVMGTDAQGEDVIAVVDPAATTPTLLRPEQRFEGGMARFGREQLVLAGLDDAGRVGFWLIDVRDPANPRRLPTSPFAVAQVTLSPDGSKLAYHTWDDGIGQGGNLHILDLDSLEDEVMTTQGAETSLWQAPQFLPDGSAVVASRWNLDGTFQLTVVPTAGGPDRGIGPVRTQDGGGADYFVSPDGRTVYAIYHDDGVDDGKIWSIDVASGKGTELPWPAPDYLTWQRIGQ